MAYGNPLAVIGIHVNHVTFIGFALDIGYGTREHPRVETQERFLLTSLQYYTLLHLSLLFCNRRYV